ncbi:hypothetical protein ESA94_10045 [Lacibacter luteus]|uniref:Uncharacterized protein n=1 Tax=Lacibacter luteus TaxID=2508719 RepID=A0A4Q1CK97_9BACT|nr:hypothetical protein [Lacibacter luteus]RXK60794.1 hypothetical protein ESA94_10045 [Lacibacter luteus]
MKTPTTEEIQCFKQLSKLKMTKPFIGIILLTVLFIRCDEKASNQNKIDKLQNIVIDKQKDWGGNFKLHIQNKSVNDSSYIYTVCSVEKGLPIGFELEIPVRINKFGDGVIFRSLGDTSDNFLKLLYSIYGLNLQPTLKFTKKTSCSYASLNDLGFKGDGQKRLETINYIKVFFEGDGENEYAELYLNIDEPNGMIEFEEKDFEYRPYIVFFLTADL